MHVLLTGAAGFLGSHLADRLLADGHTVLGVDNFLTGSQDNIRHLATHPGFSFRDCDVTLPLRTVLHGPFDGVIHAASPASPVDYYAYPMETLRVGSHGTEQCLEIARRHNARFLLLSTSEVYGDPQVHPQTEDYWGHVNPNGLRSVYDEAKRFAEAMTMAARRTWGVNTAIARIFNTYGPRMRPNDGRVVSNFITQALSGQPLTVYGSGAQTRSFCYVSDEVDGLLRLFYSQHPGPMNIGNPIEVTVRAVAELVRRHVGVDVPIQEAPLPADDPKVRCPNIRLAQSVLGWTPTIDLATGLAATVPAFVERLAAGSPGARTLPRD
jgi:dTDP-glucose 4,6-dehydratase